MEPVGVGAELLSILKNEVLLGASRSHSLGAWRNLLAKIEVPRQDWINE